VASLYPKKVSGNTYWYLREMGRVGGKPKMISERYLGTAADIAAAMETREAAALPERTRHLAFGDVAAAWGILEDLGVAAVIDEVTGSRQAGAALSAGTYLALAALNRLVAPCSKAAFADWWKTTAGDRLAKIGAPALDHRYFWDAMHAVTLGQLEEISRTIAVRIVGLSGVDCSSVALDMTSFAAFIATANGKAPVAQRGKAKQKRADLRLVGLGLVVTRDGGIPLTWHAYPGDRPDVTQFPAMTDQLLGQYQAVCAAAGGSAGAADMTVVFDAGQNSEANLTHLAGTGMHYIGSVPASDCPDLTALPASRRSIVDAGRFGGLTAQDTRRVVYGAERRAILTHSPQLHQSQAAVFDGTTLAKAGKKLDELAATLARGKTCRPREKVRAEIEAITARPWVRRVITWQLDGDRPRGPAPGLVRRPGRPRRAGRGNLRQARADHRSRRLARARGHRRVPVPVRGRVLFLPDERPARGVLLPDAPLDRAQHPRPRLHLRPGSADRPPDAPHRRPGRTAPLRPPAARPARRHRRDRPDLPLHRRPAQSPPHDHRAHRRPARTLRNLRPGQVGTPKLGHRPKQAAKARPTSRNSQPASRSSETQARATVGLALGATHYERVTVRCSHVQKPALASCSQVAAGGGRWLLMAVRRHARNGYQVHDGAAPSYG